VIKILAAISNPSGAVSFYRGLGPLLRMQKDHPDFISVTYCSPGQAVEWPDLFGFDVLFNIRPDSKSSFELIRRCRQAGMKVWNDWDDLLWELSKDHVLYSHYQKKEVRKEIAECMAAADVNTFSTAYLESRAVDDFGINNNRLVGNAIDFGMQKMAIEYQGGQNVLWRGSPTHQNDLYVHREAIINKALQYDRSVHFHGYNPFFITNALPKFAEYGFGTLPDYFENIRNGSYRYMIVPLAGNPFNYAKSNIAELEAVAAGIIPVVPDWAGWRAGVKYGRYTPMASAIDMIESMNADQLIGMWQEMATLVREKYNLKDKNVIRKNILKQLVV